jgi:hypothetical protein
MRIVKRQTAMRLMASELQIRQRNCVELLER